MLVCKHWYRWVKEQTAGDCLTTQPMERLFLICSSNECRIIAAEGILAEDRSTLNIHLLPYGPPERERIRGRVMGLTDFTPTFALDGPRIELLSKREKICPIARASYDLRKRVGWSLTALPPPERVGCIRKNPAEGADLGRGCGLGPHESLCLHMDPFQPLVVQSESGESLACLEGNEASSHISFTFPKTDLLTLRGDCYLFGADRGVCLNRKSGKGDRFVSYIWSTADGRALPTSPEVEWSGVLVGCR